MSILRNFRRRVAPALVAVLLLGAVATAHADAPRPPVAKYVKAYAAGEGAKVFTLRYDAPEKQQALVQVTGIDHALDGRILRASVQATARDTRYTVELQGRPFVLLIVAGDGGGELYLPGAPRAERVRYDEDLSEQGNAQHFLTAYQEQAAAR